MLLLLDDSVTVIAACVSVVGLPVDSDSISETFVSNIFWLALVGIDFWFGGVCGGVSMQAPSGVGDDLLSVVVADDDDDELLNVHDCD